MLSIIVIILISSWQITPIENTVWTSLNNRGVEPRILKTIKDNHRIEPVMTSSSQLINDYSLIVDSKGENKLPKVVYNDPNDLLVVGSSSTNHLIKDDADIGFDHEDDDSNGPVIESVNNSNYPKSANLINGNNQDDVSKDAVGNKIKDIDQGPVTVIPSPPTVSPLWLNNNNNNYNNQRDNNNYDHTNHTNEAIKFDDVTPLPPVPIASATTRSPRRIIRARKQPDQQQQQQSRGKSPASNIGNRRNKGNNLNRFDSFSNRNNNNNNEEKSLSGENNSFESINRGGDTNSISGGNRPINQLKPVIKSYTDYHVNSYEDFNPYGQPGIDFPAFSSPPLTNFRCSSQRYPGYYADPEAYCQAFYICQPDGREDAFLCPNGTLFNQKYFICDWYYNVDCSSSRNFYSLNSLLYIQPGVNNAVNNQRKKSARLSSLSPEGPPSAPYSRPGSSVDYIERDNDANYDLHDNYNKIHGEFDSSYEIRPRTDNNPDSGENENDFVYPLKANEPDSDGKLSNYIDRNQSNHHHQQQQSNLMSKSESNNLPQGQRIKSESKKLPNDQNSAIEFNVSSKPRTKSRKQTNWWIAEDLTSNLGTGNNKVPSSSQSKRPTINNGSIKI
ncbi:putative uncharacterized protein DDB_G0282133 [Panonychus citri]|uniref:putative uncharacterized protein DDB_G0282133 n=1 Tax=Panonychus citri TaxID=50023 RepID=UPI0023075639|nr:putative uncharacterized protein DDB_G0282133 [Panonychus citri]